MTNCCCWPTKARDLGRDASFSSIAAAECMLRAVTCEIPEKTESPSAETSSAAFLAFNAFFFMTSSTPELVVD